MTTEPDNVREELQRVEARIAELRDQNARLERELVNPNLRRWTAAGIVAAAIAGTLANTIATKRGDAEGEREIRVAHDVRAAEIDAERAAIASCKGATEKSARDLVTCHEQLRVRELENMLLASPRP